MSAYLNYLKYPAIISSTLIAAASGALYWKQKYVIGSKGYPSWRFNAFVVNLSTLDIFQRAQEPKKGYPNPLNLAYLITKMFVIQRRIMKLYVRISLGPPTKA